jgi:hypothetical protein
MDDIRVRFGKAVRNKRHKLGVSQEEFADIAAWIAHTSAG